MITFQIFEFHVLGQRFEFYHSPTGKLAVFCGDTLVIDNAHNFHTPEQVRADCIQWMLTGRTTIYPQENIPGGWN